MFTHLTEFQLQRTTKEAFGFYIAYTALFVGIGMVIGFAYGVMVGDTAHLDNALLIKIGAGVAVICCVTLAICVMRAKGLFKYFSSYIGLLGIAAVSILAGALGGMIAIAYVTTRKSHTAVEEARSEVV